MNHVACNKFTILPLNPIFPFPPIPPLNPIRYCEEWSDLPPFSPPFKPACGRQGVCDEAIFSNNNQPERSSGFFVQKKDPAENRQVIEGEAQAGERQLS
jgi:hypothetical protein